MRIVAWAVSWLKIWWFRLETWRLRQHFKRVETILRNRSMASVPVDLHKARQTNLAQLHEYVMQGVFPRNYNHRGKVPCFIDAEGRACAVGHLIVTSNHAPLAHRIAERFNYALIAQMDCPELDGWAAGSGLSKQELQLIQPGYWYAFSGELLMAAIVIWTASILTVLTNAVRIIRKQHGSVEPVLGIIISIALLIIGIICFYGADLAYYLGTHPDYPYDLPLNDVAPLVWGGVVSLILALITGGTSFYCIHNHNRHKHDGD